MRLKNMMKNDLPVPKVSLRLMKIQRTNLTSLEKLSESRFEWEVVFDHWSIRRNTRFHRKAPSDNTAGVLSWTFIVKNIFNSLTYTIASSCVCTSPLAVMTVVGLHDFVKVSISASLKTFLLIMCIDAPESTTKSRSSDLGVDAGRHLFSEGEKMLLFGALSTVTHFRLAGTLLLPLFPPETDPQILERWCYAHEVHLGKKNPIEGF